MGNVDSIFDCECSVNYLNINQPHILSLEFGELCMKMNKTKNSHRKLREEREKNWSFLRRIQEYVSQPQILYLVEKYLKFKNWTLMILFFFYFHDKHKNLNLSLAKVKTKNKH